MQFEAHLRVSASVKQEQSLLHGRVNVVVVGKLHEWEEVVPVILSLSDEDVYVLL